MTTEPTSEGTGETQVPSTGATPTTASTGVTPQKPTLTLEEVLKENAELKHAHTNAREQADRQAKQLEKFQKQEKEAAAAKEAADLAQLSELEQEKKQRADAEARIKQYQQELVKSQIKLAAKDKGIQVDTDIIASYLYDKLEKDDNGMPTNLDKLLDDLIKSNPVIAKKPDESATTPAQTANQRTAPATPAMNPGRSNIAPSRVHGRGSGCSALVSGLSGCGCRLVRLLCYHWVALNQIIKQFIQVSWHSIVVFL